MPVPQTTAVPRVLSDAVAVLSNPAAYAPTLVQMARLAAISAAGRTLPQRTRDPLASLTAPRVLPTLRMINGGRA